jgi:transposase InsO family protein
MVKRSKGSARVFARIPSGHGFSLHYRMPDTGPLRGAALSPKAKQRLRWLDYARTHTVAEAARHFDISIATIYRWKAPFDPYNLTTLEDRPSTPHHPRRPTWTATDSAAVLAARQAHPRWGKDNLAILLRQHGHSLSVSMIGRILRSLNHRGLLIEPRATRLRPHSRYPRPYAVRKPAAYSVAAPGDLLQLDTMHLTPLPGVERRQFTTIDRVSRCCLLGVRATATAGTARDFLADLLARLPFAVRAIQVDGGAEFMAGFESACREHGIALFVLPPRSPKLNGCVERLNGTSRREFRELYDGDLDLPPLQEALRAWEHQHNHLRPHQALGYRTPADVLASFLEDPVSRTY